MIEPMNKPFLLLQSRPEDEASDDEYAAFLRFGGLRPWQLERVRIDQGQHPVVQLSHYSGIIMGGGPANFALAEADKPSAQRAFEAYVVPLVQRIIATDTPFLGACLGIGALTTALGGRMSFDFGEVAGPVEIQQTAAAAGDAMLSGLPERFYGIVGHKEGLFQAPTGSVALARSERCIQMLRVGRHVYATQFHPELDADGLEFRLNLYKHAGYCQPEEVHQLVMATRRQRIDQPVKILRSFVERYAVRCIDPKTGHVINEEPV